jgi:hypothetical protein
MRRRLLRLLGLAAREDVRELAQILAELAAERVAERDRVAPLYGPPVTGVPYILGSAEKPQR